MRLGARVGRIAVPLAAAAGLLAGSAGAPANHIPGATYTGTVQGGGTVSFTVSPDGSAVAPFSASDFSGGTCSSASVNLTSLPIVSHAFTRTSPSPSPHVSGTFPGTQSAEGTVRAFGGPCDTGAVPWTATTDAEPPDTTPPDTTIDDGPEGLINDPTPTFAFSSSEPAGATFECRVDGAPFAPCASPHTTAPVADGPHTFEVRALDAAANVDPSPAQRAFQVDATPPETRIDGAPPASNALSPVSFAFSANEPSTFQCVLDGSPPFGCTSPLQLNVAPGQHSFSVWATDGVGNADPSPAVHQFTVVAPQGPGPGPGGAPGPGPGGAPAPGPSQSELLAVRTANLAAALRRGLPLTAGCPAACRVTVKLHLARKAARRLRIAAARTVVVATGRATLARAGHAALRARFTRTARKRLRRARRVALTARAAFTDPTGTRRISRRVTLARNASPATAPDPGGGGSPSPGTPGPSPSPSPSPAPGPAANRPPAFPDPMQAQTQTQFHYDDFGHLTGVTTTITVTTPASDADGDQISYSWTATNGTIQGNGLSATWQRPVQFGQPADGDATITAADGRGGTDAHTFQFR